MDAPITELSNEITAAIDLAGPGGELARHSTTSLLTRLPAPSPRYRAVAAAVRFSDIHRMAPTSGGHILSSSDIIFIFYSLLQSLYDTLTLRTITDIATAASSVIKVRQ